MFRRIAIVVFVFSFFLGSAVSVMADDQSLTSDESEEQLIPFLETEMEVVDEESEAIGTEPQEMLLAASDYVQTDKQNIVVNGQGEKRTVSVSVENLPEGMGITLSSVDPDVIELVEKSTISKQKYDVWFALDIGMGQALTESVTVTISSDKLAEIPEGAVLYRIESLRAKVRKIPYQFNKDRAEVSFESKELSTFMLLVPKKKETESISISDSLEEPGAAVPTYYPSASVPSVVYRTHVQSYGWQNYVRDGSMSGTQGQRKRLEGIDIKLSNMSLSGGVSYRAHVQTYGWQDWKNDGNLAGTTGESKRLEAIQIKLTGEVAERYDIYYQTHIQHFGWTGWAKNGEMCGSAGYAYRMEGIRIKLVEKNDYAPGPVGNIFYQKNDAAINGAEVYNNALVKYNTHVQTFGWQNYVTDGSLAGTTGRSKRLEGIHIALTDAPYPGGIAYRTHIQTHGWQAWKADGELAGTTGEAKRLEAIQIKLTGEMAKCYDVYYQVHMQHFGWSGWAKNGEMCGSAGYSYRMEGIRIKLLPKGEKAPGSTTGIFYQR